MRLRNIIVSSLLLFTFSAFTQDWKVYPYHEEETVINFPEDEGWHEGELIEWWYTTTHLHGEETGNDYTVMLTYFFYDTLGFDGFRLLNIANETTGEFFSEMQVCSYTTLSETHLEIEASLVPSFSTETWVTSTDEDGNLLPFEYDIAAASADGSISLHYNTIKQPLVVGETGLFNQGIENYTYYYSLTGIEATGTLTIGNITEPVTGSAWIDRQYGSFNPLTGEAYEWFSLQLSNGMDINLWNIFTAENEIPDVIEYQMFSAYVDEDATLTSLDFDLKRLEFKYTTDNQRCYASKWQLTSDIHDIDLTIATNHSNSELSLPFYFFEGSTSIEGTVNGEQVTGFGFAELLHRYEVPQMEIIHPSETWDTSQPISWSLSNPDGGRPVYYDIDVSSDDQVTYNKIAEGIEEEEFLWDPAGFPVEDLYWFRITGYSIDSTLAGTVETSMAFPLTTSAEALEIEDLIKVFPNPANDFLSIEMEHEITGEVKLSILNELGQILNTFTFNGISESLDLNIKNLEPGRYFIKIMVNKKRASKPIVFVKK
jgi:predicted secreted hydrolase